MREMIRGVVIASVALALLVGCLILIAEVGLHRLTSDGLRVAGPSARVAAAAPARSGPTPGGIAPAESGLAVAPKVEATTKPAAESLRRAAPAGVVVAAGDRTKPPRVALAAPAGPAAGQARALLLRVDDDSSGGWVGRYGKRGYCVAMAGEPTSLPAGVLMSMARSHLYIWSPVTTDRRGLSIPADPPRRSAGQWFSWDQFSLDLDLRGRGEELQVALYLLDWDSDARAQRLDVTDAESGVLLLSRSDEHFRKGRYLLLRLSGHVALRITKTAGANCTLSGVFLDDLPAAAQ